MQFIRHRVNSLTELETVAPAWGVEIDLRSQANCPGKLHLSHDPWKLGDDFEQWLRLFKKRKIRGPIILNTKEDGLEEKVLALMRTYGISRYFFLDTAFPTLVKWAILKRNKNFAARLSVYEKPESLVPLRGKVEWVWADCFGGKPLEKKNLLKLRSFFKVCLVSPELQGRPVKEISKFASLRSVVDAVCTKRPDLWS